MKQLDKRAALLMVRNQIAAYEQAQWYLENDQPFHALGACGLASEGAQHVGQYLETVCDEEPAASAPDFEATMQLVANAVLERSGLMDEAIEVAQYLNATDPTNPNANAN